MIFSIIRVRGSLLCQVYRSNTENNVWIQSILDITEINNRIGGDTVKYKLMPFPNEKTALSAKMDDKELFLTYDQLSAFGRELSSDDAEEVSAVFNGDLIVGTVTGYNGQAGMIFVWDPVEDRIVHVTNGEFAVRAILNNNKVYSFHYISYWGKQPEFAVYCEDLGCRDAHHDPSGIIEIPDELKHCPYPENGDIGFEYDHSLLKLRIGTKSFIVQA